MKQPVIYPQLENITWSEAWESNHFRIKAIVAIALFILLALLFPYFFAIIEARPGILLNDWLLQKIPARDSSVTIFIFVWATTLLVIIRSIQFPAFFLTVSYSLIILALARVITISLLPLDTPLGHIPLTDPLTSITYGGSNILITKDLFFSGHTSNLFMFCLCLQKKRDKQFALLATIIVAFLVLVQHVHYSIDVIGAFIFTFFIVESIKPIQFLKITANNR